MEKKENESSQGNIALLGSKLHIKEEKKLARTSWKDQFCLVILLLIEI